ncbi:MAG: GyrI-like domain-containing protein [Thermoleophilaceae bacterium]|nr:GyrI-like domain-containing protein [Thermoleophilaceae bacterium]
MDKFDFKREFKEVYSPPAKDFSLTEIPPFRYLAVDGKGDPGTAQEFSDAVSALYPLAYTLKMTGKKNGGPDFVVGPMSATWRSKDKSAFVTGDRDNWEWTVMLPLPDWITDEQIAEARESVAARKNPAALSLVCAMTLNEGLCIQILYRGPYVDEAPVLARMHNEFMPEHGLDFNGDHHEIYLSDPGRTAPEKLKTILRQPVRRIS